jgi:AcrR family transcriptional regulator
MGKRQQRAAATAEHLLASAREVFETKGYQATTVGAIKVMASVAQEMYREAGAPWSNDPRETLARATLRFLEVFEAHKGLWRCLLEGMHQSKAIEEMWLDLRRPFIDRIARNLDRSVATGQARPINTRLAAHALGAMTEWSAFAHFELQEPGPSEATPRELADTITDLWYHAVYAGVYDAPRQPA